MPMSAMKRATVQQRRRHAVALAASGSSYAEIAQQLGYHDRSGAYKAVRAALSAHEADAVQEMRSLELARLDALQEAFWADAVAGDTKAADRVLRVIAARTKLLGLDHPDGSTAGPGGATLVAASWRGESFAG